MRRTIYASATNPRRTALMRAAIAVLAAVALMIVALLFEERGEGLRKPAASSDAPAAAATDDAKPLEVPASDVAVEQPDEALSLSVDALVSKAVENVTAPEDRPPIVVESPSEVPASDAAAPAAEAVSPGAAAKERRADQPAKGTQTSSSHETFQPLPDGYFVQLGVFYAMENAEKLRSNVDAMGLPAHLQARVVVGPFSDKREAEAARRRLRKLAKGIVVPPQKAVEAQAKTTPKQRRRTK
ncbi:MAG: SPOR domain-containing protein [Azoarcus sp.]|jgi:DedD protein|nr:SPOR domain-containing protein [Azoarcus sp.]